MIVNSVFSIIRSENGNFAVTYKGNETHFNKEDVGEEEYNKTNNLYELLRNNPRGAMREKAMKSYLDITPEAEMPAFLREDGADRMIAGFPPTAAPVKEVSAKEKVTKAIKRLMNFFTEFSFTPSFRFVNTLSHLKSVSDMRTYVMNYFKLFDSAYTPEIVKKMDSAEFKAILADLVDVTPNVSPVRKYTMARQEQARPLSRRMKRKIVVSYVMLLCSLPTLWKILSSKMVILISILLSFGIVWKKGKRLYLTKSIFCLLTLCASFKALRTARQSSAIRTVPFISKKVSRLSAQ